MAVGTEAVPLTNFQGTLLALLAPNRIPASYLAGGAAIHFAPNSVRFSDDLDFFHDSEARVASAFAADNATLTAAGYDVSVEFTQPGFIRATVTRGDQATKIDWAHDSDWRFMPLVADPLGGLLLNPVDLAVNKVLALAGRDEPRDFVDILFIHAQVLPLAALVWAAAGKDPGFTPGSLLELLKRRGRYRPADFARLQLTRPFDLVEAKHTWLAALADSERFVRARPSEEVGCLYYSGALRQFVMPPLDAAVAAVPLAVHFGSSGGVVPRVAGD